MAGRVSRQSDAVPMPYGAIQPQLLFLSRSRFNASESRPLVMYLSVCLQCGAVEQPVARAQVAAKQRQLIWLQRSLQSLIRTVMSFSSNLVNLLNAIRVCHVQYIQIKREI